jgi:hypothetical protein
MASLLRRLLTKEVALLLALWLFGFVLRVYKLDQLMTFSFDQGRDMVELTKILHGDITLIGPTTGIAGFFLGPFYFYALLPGFILGNGSPLGVAYWVAFVTSLVIPIAYLLLKRLTPQSLAVVGAVLLAIAPGALNEARVIWNPSFSVPVLVTSWWLLFNSKQKPWLLVPSLFLYGLSLQTELAYTIFLAPLYAWWMWLHSPLHQWFISTFSSKTGSAKPSLYSWTILITAAVIAASTLLPQLVFELKHNFIMTTSVIKGLTNSADAPPYSVLWPERAILISRAIQDQLFGTYRQTQPLFILLIFSFLAIAFSRKSVEQRFLLLGSVLPILGMMIFRGNHGNLFSYYLNPHYLVMILTLVTALAMINHKQLRAIITGLVIVVGIGAFLKTSEVIYHPELHKYSYAHQLAAYKYARTQTSSNPPTFEVFVPNLRPEQYYYMNEWYSRVNNVTPAQINSNATGDATIVLIYEPPFSGGSLVAFENWYKNQRLDADCQQLETTFGIINVETCVKRLNKPVN